MANGSPGSGRDVSLQLSYVKEVEEAKQCSCAVAKAKNKRTFSPTIN